MTTSHDPQAGSRFKTTKWREGYDMAEVDEFVRRAERALAARDGSVTTDDFELVRFTPVRLTQGYDMYQVDQRLDQLREQLSRV